MAGADYPERSVSFQIQKQTPNQKSCVSGEPSPKAGDDYRVIKIFGA